MNKKVWMIIFIVLVVVLIFIKNINFNDKDLENENNISNNTDIENYSKSNFNSEKNISDEELSEIRYNNLKDVFKDISYENKVLVSVEGEEIKEKEIKFKEWQEKSPTVEDSSKKSRKEIINNEIRKIIVAKEAEKNGIFLTDKQLEQIEKRHSDEEFTKKYAAIMKMSEEELKEMLKNMDKKDELFFEWSYYIMEKILYEEIKVNDAKYKKFKELQNNGETKEAVKILEELREMYIDSLVKQAHIEYFDN